MTKIMQQTNTETSHEDEQKNCHEDKVSKAYGTKILMGFLIFLHL